MRGPVTERRLDRTYSRALKDWEPEELEILAQEYGRMPAVELGKKLGRSPNALKVASFRKLEGLNQRNNIYTARAVSSILGIACSKTIVQWMNKGYIKGKRAPFGYGATLCWRFEYEDIIQCIKTRPWLCNLEKMEQSYFLTVVLQEYERDPWYNTHEAAAFFDRIDINVIHRYIARGWLEAFRLPITGKHGHGCWGWGIRKSSIDAMLADDPRPEYRRHALRESRRLNKKKKDSTRLLSRGVD
jgi:hypothetical protein